MRGEKPVFVTSVGWNGGSPPHARGKVARRVGDGKGAGITPACAGKSGSLTKKIPPRWDHPRMRGEKLSYRQRTTAVWGITPACAGKRGQDAQAVRNRGDHPRMRGEKIANEPGGGGKAGSPPHARGKVPRSKHAVRRRGITPACAGKSYRKITPHGNWGDHPRMRGEKA